MLLKCCTQYANKFGKLSSGHRTGKGQCSFQCQRMFKLPYVCAKLLQSCPTLCDAIDPLSMGFPRQQYWSGLPCPFSADPPDLGSEPVSFMSPALAIGVFTTSAAWEVLHHLTTGFISHAVRLCSKSSKLGFSST